MIVFDLKCEHAHVFEVWFRSSADYEDQKARGFITCPTCGSTVVEKSVMAPNVAAKGNTKAPARVPTPKEQAAAFLSKVRETVEANCENVGDRFPEEARAIHYGDKEARGIYGNANREAVQDLLDEGVAIMPLPDKPTLDG